MRSIIILASLTVVLLAGGGLRSFALASHQASAKEGQTIRLVMPIMNPERGKKVFVDKGCVACHAVNGVGGHDAPPMDAHMMKKFMNPFDFAARMWNHAPAMIAAQEGAFGEQINFTGQELADIIAFVHDDDAQHGFTAKDLTAETQKMMNHDHGGPKPMEAHAEEIGHKHESSKSGPPHAPGTPPHKD